MATGKLVKPEGVVCHSCDNRYCVNPDHLWVGTIADNNNDKMAKGRSAPAHGEMNANARLTLEQVRQIRSKRSAGFKLKDLSEEFGVTMSMISQIVRGVRWREFNPNCRPITRAQVQLPYPIPRDSSLDCTRLHAIVGF